MNTYSNDLKCKHVIPYACTTQFNVDIANLFEYEIGCKAHTFQPALNYNI